MSVRILHVKYKQHFDPFHTLACDIGVYLSTLLRIHIHQRQNIPIQMVYFIHIYQNETKWSLLDGILIRLWDEII